MDWAPITRLGPGGRTRYLPSGGYRPSQTTPASQALSLPTVASTASLNALTVALGPPLQTVVMATRASTAQLFAPSLPTAQTVTTATRASTAQVFAPSVAAAGSVSAMQVPFSWNAVPGAESYQLEIGTSSGASNVSVTNVGNVLTYTVTLLPGTYWSRVRAVASGVPGDPSTEFGPFFV